MPSRATWIGVPGASQGCSDRPVAAELTIAAPLVCAIAAATDLQGTGYVGAAEILAHEK